MRSETARALAALYARVPLGMRLGLGPMREACARAGHPEAAFAAVHVAGTNGKGSTCAMLEAMARASDLRTGLYTSPHLTRFAERIRIDGEPVDDATLTSLLERALDVGPDLSFFETATLAAFLAFAEARVDLAIVEVGIGGRLDATNVLPPPRVGAITRVALDHTDRLGETLAEIAREKAGIAKPGMRVVLGAFDEAVRAVAARAIEAAGATVIDPADPSALPGDLGLSGAHQRENARVAWALAEELAIPVPARVEGLARVRWPGRLEHLDVARGPLAGPWVLDGAHNVDGIDALVRHLTSLPTPPGAVVYGALADKAWHAMLSRLAAVDVPRFYVAPEGRAPAAPTDLAAHVPGTPSASLVEALAAARRAAGPDGTAVVCGSLYLVGAARAELLGLPRDPSVAL